MAELLADERAGNATAEALDYMASLFGGRNGDGIRMAATALRLAIPEAQITAVATGYVERMLDAVREAS